MGYRQISVLLLCIILFALGGCRYRISYDEADTYQTAAYQPTTQAQILPEEIPPEPETNPPEHQQHEFPSSPDETTQESPTPPPEYPPQYYEETPPGHIPLTYIEAEADDFSPQEIEIINEDARRYGTEEGGEAEHNIGIETYEEITDNTVTLEIPAEDEGQAAIGDDGGVIGVIAAYSTLLRQGINTMFPCQLLYIYTETADDFVTVGRGSEIYRLMANAGGVNVSGRLTEDRLTVTADWVVRRNPDIIVKFVDESVLGSNISSTYFAAALNAAITERPGWGATEAVRNNRIILFSEQMLESEATQLAVKLLVARLMYPELFEDVNVNATVAELTNELSGTHIYTPITL